MCNSVHSKITQEGLELQVRRLCLLFLEMSWIHSEHLINTIGVKRTLPRNGTSPSTPHPPGIKPTKFCLLLDMLTVDYSHCIQVFVEHLDEHQVFISYILCYWWSFKELSCYIYELQRRRRKKRRKSQIQPFCGCINLILWLSFHMPTKVRESGNCYCATGSIIINWWVFIVCPPVLCF